ncbi:MAG: UPF0236 family protein [Saprospiraceae bacterium]
MSNTNKLVVALDGQKTSPFLQEKLVYIGQLDCYERGSEIAELLLNITTNDTAIYRIKDKIGEQCNSLTEEENFREPITLSEDEYLYVQSDGSMLMTREESWKEVKLCRVFKSTAIYNESQDRNWIKSSDYVGHLGWHHEFEDKMSKVLDDSYRQWSNQLVFINDGAKWQWNWIDAEYPEATQILDYYHAMENIGKYVSVVVKKDAISEVMEKFEKILKTEGIKGVIPLLKSLPRSTQEKEEKYQKLMTYISNNVSRMEYPNYIKKGLLIGSGAIESAHRTVLQKRMKQSGQRWSKRGLRNIINLRVVKMSGYWDKIRDLIKNAA